LLEGTHPLRGPEDLKHHTLIHDRSMAPEGAFPTWRTWLQAAGFPDINCERGLQINDSAAAYQATINGSGVATAIPELRRSRIGSALKRKPRERMLASGSFETCRNDPENVC